MSAARDRIGLRWSAASRFLGVQFLVMEKTRLKLEYLRMHRHEGLQLAIQTEANI